METLPASAAVSLKDAVAIWDQPPTDNSPHPVAFEAAPTLDRINIEIPKGKLVGVIGPVGAGKTSLLEVLLRELTLKSGTININGTISYANQEPWVFAASVRQNILFGEEYNHDRYNAVVKCCALLRDFEQFENGDLSIIGEKGSLSGGQKARIKYVEKCLWHGRTVELVLQLKTIDIFSLARACYRNADIYLLDDPLSAVDAHVGTHLFNKCIGPNGYLGLSNKTRILVTHQVHFLKDADWLVVLNGGKIEVQGSPTDLATSGVDFAKLVGLKNEPNQSTEGALPRRSSITGVSADNTSVSDSEESNESSELLGGPQSKQIFHIIFKVFI